jgi:hypothetical protein
LFFWKKKKPSHARAMDWFKANMVAGQGIIVHTKQPVPYPEVTGYYIPTLYNWGEQELARSCTRWLLSIQLPTGAFPAPGWQALHLRHRARSCAGCALRWVTWRAPNSRCAAPVTGW